MGLTKAYIDDHLEGVHTFDSWGRTIFELALNEARKKVRGRKGAKFVEMPAVIRVSPVLNPVSRQEWCASVTVTLGTPPNTSTSTVSHHQKGRDTA